MNDHIEQFTLAMRSAGLDPDEQIADDGELHRIRDRQDKAGKKDLWYILYGDGIPAGSFGHWARLDAQGWQAKADKTLTADERRQIETRRVLAQAERDRALQQVRAECIAKAEKMLAAAHDPDMNHPYITGHNVKPYGARQLKEMLLIPVVKGKALTGLQIITTDGKKFLTGTEKAGAFCAIKGKGDAVYLLEGWADACKVHELTGASCIVCFDCGNLAAAGKTVRALRPDCDMVFVADNDPPGIAHATEAAQATGARLAIPAFPGADGKDICDLARISGDEAVKSCLQGASAVEAIAEHGLDAEAPLKPAFDLSRLTLGRDIADGDYTVTFIVDKLIPEQSISLFYAKGGSGKSTVATQIAAAVVSGTPFMGLTTINRPVVVIDYENPMAVLRKRINAVEGAETVHFWTGINEPPQLDKSEWTQLQDLIATLQNPLIIIDTLSSACSGLDILNNGDYSPVMRKIVSLRNAGATIVLLHHTPKADETKYIGASCIYNQVDHVLAMYPTRTAGDDKEAIDEDDPKVYRFGTRDKTRFEHFSMHIQFDDDTATFVIADDPDKHILDQIHKLITEQTGINQSGIINQISGVTTPKLKKLLKANDGRFWTVEPGERNAKIYRPIQLFSYSTPRGEKLNNWNPVIHDTQITERFDTAQSRTNSELVSYSPPFEKLEKLTVVEEIPDFDF